MSEILSNLSTSIEPLDKLGYYTNLVSDINLTKSGDRILLVTMAILPELEEVATIIQALEKAALRGVDVLFSLDAYNLIMSQTKKVPGPLYFNKSWPPKTNVHEFDYLLKLTSRLSKSGVKIGITNKPERSLLNPFSHRSHIKMAVINDTTYIGGCNLSQVSTSDIMLKLKDKKTANWLFDTMGPAVQARSIRENFRNIDKKYQIDPYTTLFIDAGVKNQSIIYDRALRIIDEATEWIVITCQFFPHSTTAKHLLEAHKRGVKIAIFFNDPKHHTGFHHVILQSLVTQFEKTRMPATFFDNKIPLDSPFVHAKIITNEKEAMVGSHNYVPAGVKFGTAEIAIHRKDPKFATQIRNFTEKLTH